MNEFPGIGQHTVHNPLQIYLYMVKMQKKNKGLPPTTREMAEEFNTSTSVIHYILKKLIKFGLVEQIRSHYIVSQGQWFL